MLSLKHGARSELSKSCWKSEFLFKNFWFLSGQILIFFFFFLTAFCKPNKMRSADWIQPLGCWFTTTVVVYQLKPIPWWRLASSEDNGPLTLLDQNTMLLGMQTNFAIAFSIGCVILYFKFTWNCGQVSNFKSSCKVLSSLTPPAILCNDILNLATWL